MINSFENFEDYNFPIHVSHDKSSKVNIFRRFWKDFGRSLTLSNPLRLIFFEDFGRSLILSNTLRLISFEDFGKILVDSF